MRRKLKLVSISALAALACVTVLALTGIAADVAPVSRVEVPVAGGLRAYLLTTCVLYVVAILGGPGRRRPRSRYGRS